MVSKKPTERPRRKGGRRLSVTVESPEAIFGDGIDAVQRLLRSGHIDQESADALTKFLLAGYVNYSFHQLVNEVFTDDFLDSLIHAGLPDNE